MSCSKTQDQLCISEEYIRQLHWMEAARILHEHQNVTIDVELARNSIFSFQKT